MKFDYLELDINKCPLCGLTDFSTLKENDRYFMGIVTVGCANCGLIQTNPRPTQKGIDHFYTHDYRTFYQGQKLPTESYVQRFNKKLRLEKTSLFLSGYVSFESKETALLDIGCSEGELFSALRLHGYKGRLYGVEINPEFAVYASGRGGAEVVPSIEALNGKFDIISMNHVFEHFLQPNLLLMQLKDMLSKTGLVYIDVPDAEEYSRLDDLHIAHLFHYTERTLAAILEKSGFQIIFSEKYTPIAHPKSLRIVAKPSQVHLDSSHLPGFCDELATWSKIRKISIFQKRIRIFLGLIPGLARVYRFFKFHLMRQ